MFLQRNWGCLCCRRWEGSTIQVQLCPQEAENCSIWHSSSLMSSFNEKYIRKKAALMGPCWGECDWMAYGIIVRSMLRTDSAALTAAASLRPTPPAPALSVLFPSWRLVPQTSWGMARRLGPACPSSVSFRYTKRRKHIKGGRAILLSALKANINRHHHASP